MIRAIKSNEARIILNTAGKFHNENVGTTIMLSDAIKAVEAVEKDVTELATKKITKHAMVAFEAAVKGVINDSKIYRQAKSEFMQIVNREEGYMLLLKSKQ